MIIARYAVGRSLLVAAVMFVGVALFLWLFFFLPGEPVSDLKQNPQWAPFIVFGFMGCGWIALAIVMLLRQILFQHGAAIWLDRDEIVHQTVRLIRTRIDSIQSASAITISSLGIKSRVVVLYLRDGRVRRIPVGLLQDSQEQVAATLNAVLSKRVDALAAAQK